MSSRTPPTVPSAAEPMPAVLESPTERYEVLRPLGEGGFGITHLARRVGNGQDVVIKQLRLQRLDDWKAFDLFEREAAVLESLRHPNIPAFVDHFQLSDGDRLRGFALVQAHVPGETLREIQARRPAPGAAQLRTWLVTLLEICAYLHARTPPVIHRDITPKNVIVRADGQPVLIDFGTVQHALRSASTIASTAAGTFGYAAPEQLLGRAVPASDLYGLAMTYLAVATGREPEDLPFAANRVQVGEALRGHDTHPRLVLLLEEMLEPDAARRPATAGEVLDRLRAIPAAAASPATVIAPRDDDDDATPAARLERRWRARAARATRLGRQGAATFAPAPETEDLRTCVIDERGRRALCERGFKEGVILALDLDTLEISTFAESSGHELFHADVLFDGEGRGALLQSFDHAVLLLPAGDGPPLSHRVSGLDSFAAAASKPGAFAVSPDQRLMVHLDHGVLVATELETGQVAQRIEPSGGLGPIRAIRGTLRFTPDGAAVLFASLRDTRIVDHQGGVQLLERTIVACGHDGRTVARASDSKIELGTVAGWAPFSWREPPRTLRWTGGCVEHLRFSPDDRRLALGLESGRVVVLDVQTGDVVLDAGDPYRPGLGLDDIEHVGFCADGRRLVVAGRCIPHPLATKSDTALVVYSLTQGEPLGTLRLAEDRRRLYGFTALGPHGSLEHDGADPAPRGKGKRGKGKGKGRMQAERKPSSGAQARGLLLDTPPHEVLGDRLDAALDLRDRLAYWGGPLGEGRLPREHDLRSLVEASAGLTHLLPLVPERLRSGGQAAPARFGRAVAEGVSLPVPPLLEQLAGLAARTEGEREVLFEDMLSSLVTRETARLAEAAATKPARILRNPLVLVAVAVAVLVGLVLGLG